MHTTEAPLAPDPAAEDRADMAALAAGQEAALGRLMARHAEPLFRFLARMLGNEEDASDLAQETFIRICRAAASYQPSQKFTTWAYTIAANLARNQLRWRARHPAISLDQTSDESGGGLADTLPAHGPDPSQASVQAERIQAVRAAVAQLPEDLREAIVLCEWEELSVAEAAAIMEVTAKAVESKLYRARKLLREQLGLEG